MIREWRKRNALTLSTMWWFLVLALNKFLIHNSFVIGPAHRSPLMVEEQRAQRFIFSFHILGVTRPTVYLLLFYCEIGRVTENMVLRTKRKCISSLATPPPLTFTLSHRPIHYLFMITFIYGAVRVRDESGGVAFLFILFHAGSSTNILNKEIWSG